MKVNLITQLGDDDSVFKSVFGKATTSPDLDRLDVAVAYATSSGIPALTGAIGRDIEASRWAIGIDDAVSQPSAIEHLRDMPGSEVRLASSGPHFRFHPKIYQLWSSARPEMCVSYVGSGNFTSNGLARNVEAGVVLSAESVKETGMLRGQWQAMWDGGHPLDQAGLDVYRTAYESLRAARKKLDKEVKDKVLDDNLIGKILGVDYQSKFDGTPQSASVAWIDCGSASAGGRDLEFPAAMVPFFRLKGDRVERSIRVEGKTVFELTFTMRQDNGMWRLLLSSDAITAAIGRPNLRPTAGGNRSDLAIVFQRAPDTAADFDILFLLIGSPEHATLVQDTQKKGKLHRTTTGAGGRNFGYY